MISRRPASARNTAHDADDLTVEIGRGLAAARRTRRENIHDVAATLRIRVAYLEAIEAGDLGVFPGRPYALGFVKSYADYLDLNGNECVRLLKESAAPLNSSAALSYREPVVESARSYKLLGTIAVAAAAALYVGWYAYSSGQLDLAQSVADLGGSLGDRATQLVAGEQPEIASPVAVGDARVADNAMVILATPTPSLDQLRLDAPEVEPLRPTASAGIGSADAASAQAAERLPTSAGALLARLEDEQAAGRMPGTMALDGSAGRVALVAHESSWIQVRSESRDYVRTRTLDVGERFQLPNRDDLALWTGNAGGVEVQVDGQSIGLLGRRGDVIRALPLSVEALEARRTALR